MKDERTYKIIGAALEVHKDLPAIALAQARRAGLGCGFLEAVYHEALEREFKFQEISHKSQPTIEIKYKGEPLEKNINLISFAMKKSLLK